MSKTFSDTTEPPQNVKIESDTKTGLPTNVVRGGDNSMLTAKALSKLSSTDAAAGPKYLCSKSVLSTLSDLSIRPKDEKSSSVKDGKGR